MLLRKLRFCVVFISLALVLSSCVEVRGDISVNSAARFNGELTYTINKSLASAAGISSLADLNRQVAEDSANDFGFCKDTPFTEDSTDYIFKCPLKDALSKTGDITASVVGRNIVFRYKGNLDSSATDTERTDIGSVSLTIKFIDPVLSYKENKIGLVRKVDSLTYRISGYATEPMDIEIIADCSSRCGVANVVPVPTKTNNPTDAASAASAATDAANAATDAANIAAESIDFETSNFLDEFDVAVQKATTSGIKTELNFKKVLTDNQVRLIDIQLKREQAESLAAKSLGYSNDKSLTAEIQRMYTMANKNWLATARTFTSIEKQLAQRIERISNSQEIVNRLATDYNKVKPLPAGSSTTAKKTTITCIKGKIVKKVTAVKPKCPSGYKVKK